MNFVFYDKMGNSCSNINILLINLNSKENKKLSI